MLLHGSEVPCVLSPCGDSNVPHNLFVFSLSRLHLQALVIHLVHVTGGVHVAQNIVLQFWDRLQRVSNVLVLLYVANDLCRLCPLRKVDQIGLFDD